MKCKDIEKCRSHNITIMGNNIGCYTITVSWLHFFLGRQIVMLLLTALSTHNNFLSRTEGFGRIYGDSSLIDSIVSFKMREMLYDFCSWWNRPINSSNRNRIDLLQKELGSIGLTITRKNVIYKQIPTLLVVWLAKLCSVDCKNHFN